jgi:hypothetical protein
MATAESYEATDITASATDSAPRQPATGKGKGKGANPLKRLWSTRSGRAVLAVSAAVVMLLIVLVRRGAGIDEPADAAATAADASGIAPTDMALDLGPTVPTTPIPSGGFQFQDYGDRGYMPSDGVSGAQPLPSVQVIVSPSSPSGNIAGNSGTATGSPGTASPEPPKPPAQAQEIARWTPPSGIKQGDPTDITGAVFWGRVKLSNGQYAPIIKYTKTGTTQIHPSWQRWMAANKVTKA